MQEKINSSVFQSQKIKNCHQLVNEWGKVLMVDGLKILLSDGDKVFLELCKTYLRKSGASVLTCQNGKEALDIIRNKRPHLVIMASEMAMISGLECCKTVKMDESLHAIPVLLTLSSGKKGEIERCRQAECDDVLLKPINRHTFYSVIKKYVTLNKRTAPRFQASFPVNWETEDGQRNCGFTVDVSTKGLFVETDHKVSVNSIVNLNFTLPASDVEVNCRARVSWVNRKDSSLKPVFPAGLGLEFVDLSEEYSSYISEYIRKEHVEPLLHRIY
jgi:CheY-like chemotaxis protein/Tfp pilus assembly protein PilZ